MRYEGRVRKRGRGVRRGRGRGREGEDYYIHIFRLREVIKIKMLIRSRKVYIGKNRLEGEPYP